MKKIYPLHDITFWKVARLFIQCYKNIWFILGVITLIPLAFFPSYTMFRLVLQFHLLIILGVFLSFIVHEYIHIRYMKKYFKAGEVGIECSKSKISIYPQFEISGNKLLIIAIMPSIYLTLFGACLYVIGKFTHVGVITFISYIYFFHMINIIPPFGDGMMILKSIFLKGGEKNELSE